MLQTREDIEREVIEEVNAADPVCQAITFHYFTSRSKGWRFSKKRGRYRRARRNRKEIRLVRYWSSGFAQWHRFPFDEVATEIIGEWADGELLKERVEEL